MPDFNPHEGAEARRPMTEAETAGSAPKSPPEGGAARGRPLIAVVLALLVGLVFGAGIGIGALLLVQGRGAVPTERDEALRRDELGDLLPAAADACRTSGQGIDIGDGGLSLTFDMKGADDYRGADLSELECLFDETGMPKAIRSHVKQTSALDGRQSEVWGLFAISWKYHPDNGLDGVLTVDEAPETTSP